MNKLLHVSKKLFLSALFGIILIFIVTTILKNTDIPSNETLNKSQEPNFDIINPSFTINNEQKISVKAKRGNFISDHKILLENNVIIKSSKFKLKTSKMTFNQSSQTAESKEVSRFQSKGTIIISEGFEITENGNIIFFNGKTKLNLKN